MSEWYYSLLGEEFGPVSVATLHELLQDGTLSGSDPVRRSNSAESITGTEFQRLHPLSTAAHSATADEDPEDAEDDEADAPCDQFWFQLEGITLGPVSGQSLIKLAEIGRISQDTLIRRDNEFLWEPASEFHELSIVFMLALSDEPQTAAAGKPAAAVQSVADTEATESEAEDSDAAADNGKAVTNPGKRNTGNSQRSTKPAAGGRGQRGAAGSRKLGNRRRQAEAAAKAEAEDAMLQEIFAELEQKKAARSESPRSSESAATAVGGGAAVSAAAPLPTAPAALPSQAAPVASASLSGMSDPQRQAAAALAAARSSSAAAAKAPKRRSSGGGFSIPNPFAGLSDLQFDGPTKTLLGVAVVALLWFGWGPVMSLLDGSQSEYIARVEAAIDEIEGLNAATQPDVYNKKMQGFAKEFKAYSVVMTAAASQRQSAKTCLAAVNKLVDLARTDPLNAKLQKKLLDETKKLVQEYKG